MEAGSPPRLAVEWLAVGTPANRATWPENAQHAEEASTGAPSQVLVLYRKRSGR